VHPGDLGGGFSDLYCAGAATDLTVLPAQCTVV